MELVTESPFLNNEKRFLNQYNEAAENFGNADAGDIEAHIQVTFVKEKATIFSYVYDLVLFAAKLHNIDFEKIFYKGEERVKVAEALQS